VLVSSATQIDNVFHVAAEIGAADALRAALRERTVIARQATVLLERKRRGK